MRIWIKDLGKDWSGHRWAISTEKHDGIVYIAASEKEAVRKYELDKGVHVTDVRRW